MTQVYVLSGPNLGRLGAREPDVYGTVNYDALTQLINQWAAERDMAARILQSDSEAQLIGWLHEAADLKVDVVFNPAAFTHFSYAIRDAAAMVTATGGKLIEVHLTNPATRERFRHNSVISGVASGTIAGFGVDSYRLALESLTSQR